ncbi:MAG: aspartate aminotransferase family protein [Propionibacteriaceae bacterium]|jgi:glutamate-1-semialdehyde 2,1-aminomutase|nr:aspartate aminotransferase family protein [Propionibacteriaceae bacterium]
MTFATIDPSRVQELTDQESARLNDATHASRALYQQARRHLPGGVASSYQLRDPWPIYIDRGQGCRVWDVDGNERYDFHNGFGSMVQGHAHPAIARALERRFDAGSHFGCAVPEIVPVAQELARRWGLPQWRFVNSGSEATMDAIRIARAHTGRDTVMKIFGSYHGHHDAVMVSIGNPVDVDWSDPNNLPSVPYGAGIPQAVVDLTVPVPFNDAAAMETRIATLTAQGRKPACVIMEACLMNLGIVLPQPGYLEAVRQLTSRLGIVLIFDEVKTGLTMAAGGATEKFGVRPDLVTLAKSLGGGLPTGAVGGSAEVMAVIEDQSVVQVGTYSGNPLAMATAWASLTEVLTPEAYAWLDHLSDRIADGCNDILRRHHLPGYAVSTAAKGCVTFADALITDYASYIEHQNVALTELAYVWNMNRGIFMTPGREEEWTLSVAHSDEAIDAYLAAFDEMAQALTR